MRVHQLMSTPAQTCRRSTDLATVLQRMHAGNFGAMPVIDDRGRLVGIVTDRDLGLALARHPQCRATDLTAGEVMHERVQDVDPHQDVREALRAMAREQVHRLPVVDADGRVVGMLATSDLLLGIRARLRSGEEPTVLDVLETLQAIAVPPHAVALGPVTSSLPFAR